jgi:hypothetical protein
MLKELIKAQLYTWCRKRRGNSAGFQSYNLNEMRPVGH